MKKKVVILGPIPDKNGINLGGVADFNLNIAKELTNYYNVIIITNTSGYDIRKQRLSVIDVNVKKRLSILALIKMWLACRKEKPDIIISGLQYSLVGIFIPDAFKVHIVHGFFNIKDHSLLKVKLGNFINALIFKNYNVKIANSSFTKLINDEMYGLYTDYVVPLAVNNLYLNPDKTTYKRKIDILYVGRLVRTKGVFSLLYSLKYLPKETNLVFVGEGEDEKLLKRRSHELGLNVVFLGKKNSKELKKIYKSSKVFVSLNDAEPFGITFIEALISGCQIVCPNTGGQVENLINYPKHVTFIKNNLPKTIALAIKNSWNVGNNTSDLQNAKLYYSYSRVVSDMLKIFKERKNNNS